MSKVSTTATQLNFLPDFGLKQNKINIILHNIHTPDNNTKNRAHFLHNYYVYH